jgi:catechol 2,3-dioxygenase-like lactoylglutathione lyase family enzyme
VRLTHLLLLCADVERSLAFYRGLGLIPLVLDHLPEGTLRYARLRMPDGDATVSLELGAPQGSGVVIYFECEDLDQRAAALTATGYVFAEPPATKPWLWKEAALLDPDGHRLCLFQAGAYRLDPPWRLASSVTAEGAADDLSPFLAASNRGYVDAAIPSARDAQLAAYLQRLVAADDTARGQAADALGPSYTATFVAFAERMATRAVRERDVAHAELGLWALVLTWRRSKDVTTAIPPLGLLYDAARRVNADPPALFRKVAAACPADVAPVLTDFAQRDDLDEIAEEMGFAVRSDRDGFRYRRTWGSGRVDADD